MPETPKEAWIQWVALTTTLLAVCAAIAALKASSFATQVQIATTREANQWAFYQAKSIKEHSCQLNRDVLNAVKMLEVKNPKAQTFLTGRIKEYEAEISRYDKEKNQIKQEAETISKEQETLKKKNGNYALTVLLLQIAITASAISALIKKKLLWFVGLVLGLGGLAYLARAVFL